MVLGATTGWTLTVALMVDATVDSRVTLGLWAAAVAFMASIPTYWLMLDHLHHKTRSMVMDAIRDERVHTERLVMAVATEFAQAEVTRLEARREA